MGKFGFCQVQNIVHLKLALGGKVRYHQVGEQSDNNV